MARGQEGGKKLLGPCRGQTVVSFWNVRTTVFQTVDCGKCVVLRLRAPGNWLCRMTGRECMFGL